jgi:acetyl/propionyl-CoA carboxylase alpha subunit
MANYSVHCDGARVTLDILRRRPELWIKIDDAPHTVVEVPRSGAEFEVVIDGVVHRGWRCRVGDEVWIRLSGRNFVLRRSESDSDEAADSSARSLVRAEMPGIVIAVHCQAGQRVHTGDKLLTMESMKLQVTLTASHAAVVEQIHVAPEVTFARGALLVTLGAMQESQERDP